ncbi:purple acid phosphatase family protein [Paenibacillus sp. JDR-2]|uniref:purple acid phosphatase family protein n=1 Tax=Paenibacillus sp. (strain JDR-2) TaxID=324057 RepID=UPI000166BB74|nr:metallophosphoesterase family protein [Paenibacillus sp. JDR-2]ACT01845.1 metallophosphoesterase [Paenibacillus sp. JDR-2]
MIPTRNNRRIYLFFVILSLLIVGFGILINQQREGGAKTSSSAWSPVSLVSTFKSDPHSSRAFTWYTQSSDLASVLQVVPYLSTETPTFEGDGVLVFKGTSDSIDTGDTGIQGVHKAEATGLAPGTSYAYRVGDGDQEHWSDVYKFTTEQEGTTDFTFINVADSQGTTLSDFQIWGKTLNKAFQTFPKSSFIVHNGDLTENPDDESGWENLFGEARKWVTAFPFMPVTGNHDEVDDNAERFVSHFNVPVNGSESSIVGTTYSFDYGDVHFVMLNTESKLKDQAKWLEQDLAATNKTWLIVSLHRGPYAGNQKESVLKQFVPVFDKYKVDLVLQGHNHEYARSYPMRNNKIVSDNEGTVYVVTNTSGQKFNEKKEDLFYQKVHFQNYKQMFAGIHVSGDTLSYKAYDADGKLLDQFELIK